MSHATAQDERLRLFFAVPLAPTLRACVEGVQEQIRRARAGVKWVEPENLHFTVKFLGDTPRTAVPALSAIGQQVSSRHRAFELHLEGVGAFGPPARPGAVWIGCSEGARPLCALASDLDGALAQAGVCAAESRPFRAHLTIGRYRDRTPSPEPAQAISRASGGDFGGFTVDCFLLLSSRLTGRGPVYTELERFGLSG